MSVAAGPVRRRRGRDRARLPVRDVAALRRHPSLSLRSSPRSPREWVSASRRVGVFCWLVLVGPPDRALVAVELARADPSAGLDQTRQGAARSGRLSETGSTVSGFRAQSAACRPGVRGDPGVRRRGVRRPLRLTSPRGLGRLDELEPPGEDDLSCGPGVAGGVLAPAPLVASGLPAAGAGLGGADLDLQRR